MNVPSVVRQRRTARIRGGDFHSKPCSTPRRTTRGSFLWSLRAFATEILIPKPCSLSLRSKATRGSLTSSTSMHTTRGTLFKGAQALMLTLSHSPNNLNCCGGLYWLLLGLSASVPVISYTSDGR